MRDFYKRLGLDLTAPAETLARKLEARRGSPDTAAAKHILCVEHRRRVYDRARRTHIEIGYLRSNLGLGNVPEDFRVKPGPALLPALTRLGARRRQVAWWTPRLIAAGAIIACLLVFSLFTHRSASAVVASRPSYYFAPRPTATPYVPETSAFMPSSPQSLSNPGWVRKPRPTPLNVLEEILSHSTPVRPRVATSNPTPFDRPAEPLPKSGAFWTFTSQQRIAPFKVSTPAGSRFYVKLVDVNRREPVIAIFIDGGDTVRVDVPLGTFELRYALGSVWYGSDHLFGPETRYIKGSTWLTFSVGGDDVNGHEVTLYKVLNGNFRTETISAQDF